MQRGTICVVRKAWIDGVCEELIMPLVDQGQYREWSGCFSYLGD
jgi:hypothetical protein